jgi:hypothetical protein
VTLGRALVAAAVALLATAPLARAQDGAPAEGPAAVADADTLAVATRGAARAPTAGRGGARAGRTAAPRAPPRR